MTISTVEKELLGLVKVKPEKYDNRQDYLGAMVRAVEKLGNDAYDGLSEDAYKWHTAACEAMNDKELIPDMDGTLGGPTAEVHSVPNAGPEIEANGVHSEELGASDYAETELVDEGDPVDVAEPIEGQADTSAPPTAPKKRVAKGKRGKEIQPNPNVKPNKIDYTKLTGEVDRYGITIGTKTHTAIQLYERGCTSKEIEQAVGGRHYNILRRLEKEGHYVEKAEHVWRLVHKDDRPKC